MKFKKNLLLSKLNSTKRKSSSLIRRTISVVCTAVISFSTLSVCTAANVSAAAANEKDCIYFYTDSTLYNAYQSPEDFSLNSWDVNNLVYYYSKVGDTFSTEYSLDKFPSDPNYISKFSGALYGFNIPVTCNEFMVSYGREYFTDTLAEYIRSNLSGSVTASNANERQCVELLKAAANGKVTGTQLTQLSQYFTKNAPKMADVAYNCISTAISKVRSNYPDAAVYVVIPFNPFKNNGETKPSVPFCKSVCDAYSAYLSNLRTKINGIKNIKIIDADLTFSKEGSNGSLGLSGQYTNLYNDKELHPFTPKTESFLALWLEYYKLAKPAMTKNRTQFIRYFYSHYKPLQYSQRSTLCKSIGLTFGDADRNGYVDASDASYVLNIYSHLQTGGNRNFDENDMLVYDINGNNSIDASVASTILSHYADVQSGGRGIL